ncbi:hypothetical protein SAMN05443637_103344 [Pseudonocardia thermophila]|uniref:Uncharacterized protein n=1 Tax=Pseudonocardia thermophila TaxID=1848 RepID=A0A1M6QI50_PSETH|nr:hypothetical protein [Pseudonocardia thermophila]SHK19994.1 hypothetical protein SAMN05443637_103344 [Pseudonocardia thermophila]
MRERRLLDLVQLVVLVLTGASLLMNARIPAVVLIVIAMGLTAARMRPRSTPEAHVPANPPTSLPADPATQLRNLRDSGQTVIAVRDLREL